MRDHGMRVGVGSGWLNLSLSRLALTRRKSRRIRKTPRLAHLTTRLPRAKRLQKRILPQLHGGRRTGTRWDGIQILRMTPQVLGGSRRTMLTSRRTIPITLPRTAMLVLWR